jgi:hypothetical protein
MPEQDTDELYKVPLAEFVRARDTISARRRAAGDKDGAAEVKRVRRPTLPAWAANQVVWHAPSEWQRLQAAAGALRRGHETGASADELRRASREQREALQACESRAAGFLVASGHGATPMVVQKASGTLQALAYGVAGAEPGRVQEELPPPAFEALAGMGLGAPERRPEASTSAPSPAAPPPAAPARASVSSLAEAARHRAEAHARERDSAREEQQAREEQRARRRVAIGAAEERLARATRALGQARTEVGAHEKKLQELEQAAETARRAADKSRRALAAAEAEAAAADAALEALRGGGAEG